MHIDGHQHVHIIPEIAEELSSIMSNYFGIYQIRLPIEKDLSSVKEEKRLKFYQEVVRQSMISKKFFDKYDISYPNCFIGMNLMGQDSSAENFIKIKQDLEKQYYDSTKAIYVEYMCHPGYPSKNNFWDDFNCSQDRLVELDNLNNIFSSQKIIDKNYLKNFTDLENFVDCNRFNILIMGDITFGTGNSITAIRLKNLFKSLNFKCYLYNLKYLNKETDPNKNDQLCEKFEDFLLNKKIHLMIGINIWRSSKILNYLLTKKNKTPTILIPYILITAGTDANVYLDDLDKLKLMKNSINNAYKIISFNDEMINKLVDRIGNFPYEIIPQSVELFTEKTNDKSTFSVRKKYNLNDNIKITLFPASIRKIKDPLYLLNSLLAILNTHEDHVVILMGAKLEEELYKKIIKIVQNSNQDRFLIHDVVPHEDFVNIIRECNLIINSSISEGMSNVLMEAMLLGVPVLARENEGNCKLIKSCFNGFIFNTEEDFVKLYEEIYSNEELRLRIISNAKEFIKDNYNLKKETQGYQKVITECFDQYYKNIDNGINLYFGKNVHPFSHENNEIFLSAEYAEKDRSINIIDVGCGSGIFSFLFLLKNKDKILSVNELVLLDIDETCLSNTYSNFMYYKNIFKISKLTIIKSNILDSLENYKQYENYFDVVLVNLPQSPSIKPIRSK